MIRFILLQNRQGKTRLAKYYVPLEDSEKHKVEYEVHRLVVNRDPKFTNFVESSYLLGSCKKQAKRQSSKDWGNWKSWNDSLLAIYETMFSELAESDRDDFHVCVESLGAEMLELKEKLKCTVPDKGDTGLDGLKEKEQHIADLEKEIRKMKHEYKKLILKKDSDISALIAEKDFIWNQFKMKDDEFMSLFKKKQMDDERVSEMIKMQMEDKHANEIIKMLQCSLEMLQSTAGEKDQTIANLAAGRAILESDVVRLTQEEEQMKHRIEELQSQNKEKDTRIASLQSELTRVETSLTRGTRGKSRFFENSGSHSGSRNVSGVLGECHPRKRPGRLSITNAESSSIIKRRNVRQSSSGMQEAGTSPVLHGIRSPASLEIPRLFSSNFKVPKLKEEHRSPST